MRTRFFYARDTTLSPACRRYIERALAPYAPRRGKPENWKQKTDCLCACIESTLREIPASWPWPQSPVYSEAKPVVERLSGMLSQIEAAPSLLYALEKSYFTAYPTRGTDPKGHDAHLMALDNRYVQFGELLWRMREAVARFMQEADAKRRGRPPYDVGLLWLVAEIIGHAKAIFPRVPMGKGDKSVLPAIVDAVISPSQVALEDTEQERHYRRPTRTVRPGRARDIIRAALARNRSCTRPAPPSQTVTTTTTTTTTPA